MLSSQIHIIWPLAYNWTNMINHGNLSSHCFVILTKSFASTWQSSPLFLPWKRSSWGNGIIQSQAYTIRYWPCMINSSLGHGIWLEVAKVSRYVKLERQNLSKTDVQQQFQHTHHQCPFYYILSYCKEELKSNQKKKTALTFKNTSIARQPFFLILQACQWSWSEPDSGHDGKIMTTFINRQ